jgi:3-hydroxybutyryl-CoA dehydrogenase
MTRPQLVVGVVGLGSVGRELVHSLDRAGYPVVCFDTDEGIPTGSVPVTPSMAEFALADVVFEAVPESFPVKAAVLSELNTICGPSTVLVTTTASLSLPLLAVASGRPAHTVGLRVFGPPSLNSSGELRQTAMTSPGCAATVAAVMSDIGMAPTTVSSAAADAATELIFGYLNRAMALVESGYADHTRIDTAMRLGCGLPNGPFELLDRIGLDSVRQTLSELHARTGDETFAVSALLVR